MDHSQISFENLLYDGNKLSPSASIVNKNFLIKKIFTLIIMKIL